MTSGSFDPYDWKSFYFGRMGREEAARLLSRGNVEVGTFLLRDSSHPGDYSLSVRESNEDVLVRHYLIQKVVNQDGSTCVKIAEQTFTDIPMLLNNFKMRILDQTSLTIAFRKDQIEKVIGLFRFDGQKDGDLPFEAGEELEIIGKGEGKWWEARNALNMTGLIPANFVTPLSEDERGSKGQSQSSFGSLTEERLSGISTGSEGQNDGHEQRYEPPLPATAKVIFERQPNAYDPSQLKLKKGQNVLVTKKLANGQYEAELEGRTGFIPFTYVRFARPVEE